MLFSSIFPIIFLFYLVIRTILREGFEIQIGHKYRMRRWASRKKLVIPPEIHNFGQPKELFGPGSIIAIFFRDQIVAYQLTHFYRSG